MELFNIKPKYITIGDYLIERNKVSFVEKNKAELYIKISMDNASIIILNCDNIDTFNSGVLIINKYL